MWRETEHVDAGRRAGRRETRARARTVVSRRVGVGVARGVGDARRGARASEENGDDFETGGGMQIFDARTTTTTARARASARGDGGRRRRRRRAVSARARAGSELEEAFASVESWTIRPARARDFDGVVRV